jgi:hypothetical protein
MAGVPGPGVMAPTEEPRTCLWDGGVHQLARTSRTSPGSQTPAGHSRARRDVPGSSPPFLAGGQVRSTGAKSCRRSAAATTRRASLAAERRQFRAFNVLAVAATLWIGIEGARSGAAADRGPVTSLLEMRQDRVAVQPWDLSCGATVLATLLNYRQGDPVSEREIARGLVQRVEYLEEPFLVRARQGFSLLDLKRYVDEHAYLGMGCGELALADLIELAPVIVPVKLNGFNHFVGVPRHAWQPSAAGGPGIRQPDHADGKIRSHMARLWQDRQGRLCRSARRWHRAAQPAGVAAARLRVPSLVSDASR